MSSYLHFFLRSGDKFLPLATYGRGSEVYRTFGNMPYGHVCALTNQTLDSIRAELREGLERSRHELDRIDARIAQIGQFSGSIDEKLEAIYAEEENFEEVRESIKEGECTDHFISFLYDILDEARYGGEGIDPEAYLYAGIECSNPTIEDIEI